MEKSTATHTLLAFAALLAAIIGVGFFALPSAAARSGFFPFLLAMAVLACLVAFVHVRLVRLVVATPGRRRIPGYVGAFLGKRWEVVSVLASVGSLLGAQLAYLIAGGTFLHLLLQQWLPVSLVTATLIFFGAGFFCVVFGTRGVVRLDAVLLFAFCLLTLVFLVLAAPHIRPAYLIGTGWLQLPSLYGLLLFAFWGLPLVPEMTELTQKSVRAARGIVFLSMGTAFAVYALFTFSVLGVTGGTTTQDALTGFLQTIRGTGVITLVAAFGCITTFKSFIGIGLTFRQSLELDLRFPRLGALLLTMLLPFLLLLFFTQSLTGVIGVTGGLLLGVEGLLVVWAADRLDAKTCGGVHWSTVLLTLVLLGGLVHELVRAF